MIFHLVDLIFEGDIIITNVLYRNYATTYNSWIYSGNQVYGSSEYSDEIISKHGTKFDSLSYSNHFESW